MGALSVLLFLLGIGGSVYGLSCPSLDQYLSQHPGCTRIQQQAETSVFCGVEGGRVTVSLPDCSDPVSVSVEADVPRFHIDIVHVFNRTETVRDGHGTPVTAKLDRNTSHLALEVYGGTTNPPLVLFPTVFIPLNASTCMCSSLREIAYDMNLQFDFHNSSIHMYSAGCDAVAPCGTTMLCRTSPNYFNATLTIHVCDDPPSVEILVMTPEGTALHKFFNETSDAPLVLLGLDATLSVNLTQMNYSLIIAMSASSVFGETVILTDHSVILDASNCSSEAPLPCFPPPTSVPPRPTMSPTPAPPTYSYFIDSTAALYPTTVATSPSRYTTSSSSASESTATHSNAVSTPHTVSMSPSPNPSPAPVSPSCEGMEKIREELDQNPVYLLVNCSLDSRCTHIHCFHFDGSTSVDVILDVCSAGFTIKIIYPDDSQSQTFTKSGHMDLKGSEDVLLIYLTNQDNKVLGLSVNISEPEERDYDLEVVPFTSVSIDTSHCSSPSHGGDKGGLSTALIAVIAVVGALVCLTILIALCIVCYGLLSRKKKESNEYKFTRISSEEDDDD